MEEIKWKRDGNDEPAAIKGLKMIMRDLNSPDIEIVIKKREGPRIIAYALGPKSDPTEESHQITVRFINDIRNMLIGEINKLEREFSS